jgi:flagellar basal body P-ring formation protein FlgA
MRILSVMLLCCAAVPGVTSASAATLRPVTTLHGPKVFLRDLFDDAGANADRLLGPGPGPGGRITVGAAQLAAIARQFDVDWQAASNADQAVLEWPGRPLPREDALAAVREALVASGVSADCSIELPGFTAPIVPSEAAPKPVVSQLDYDPNTGRFTATLSVNGEGMDPIITRIGGQAEETVELPVGAMRLPTGLVLRPEDVHMMRVRANLVHGEVAHTVDQAIGMQMRRQVPAGQPLELADLARPNAVLRGATVQMQLAVSGLTVSGQGMALESGASGERIKVQTSGSHAVIEAEVVGPGRVRIVPRAGTMLAGDSSEQGVLR